MKAAQTLVSKLAARPPRETSGSRSANRFEFQKDWVICTILELHLAGSDYLVICDYHEDVIVLNKESEGDQGQFYQVKSLMDKRWTIANLTKQQKGGSILGKLYQNYLLGREKTESLHLVSNAHYEFTLADGTKATEQQTIRCSDIATAEVKKLATCLAKECGGNVLLPDEPTLLFEVTPLSVLDHAGHTKGKVAEFLESLLPNGSHPVVPTYQALFDEVRRKTNYEGQLKTPDDLAKHKGLGRSIVTKLLDRLVSSRNLDTLWLDINQRLTQEQYPPFVVHAIRDGWRRYQAERLDESNETLHKLREQIQTLCSHTLATDPSLSLTQLFSIIIPKLPESHKAENYLQAMILMEAYENFPFQKIDPKPKEEA